jgi:outer membrane protein OmpA-like peptidoglycan-associated protein
MGGLDVFVTSYDGQKWLRPENLNYPLNSSKDDFGFVMNGDNKSGTVSSSRTFKDAIYEFRKNDPTFKLNVSVKSKKTRSAIKEAKVEVMSWNTGKRVTLYTDAEGRVVQRLEIESDFLVAAGKDGYFSETSETSTKGKKYSEDLSLVFYLDEMVIEKPIVLENIYYDFDKWEIRPDAEKELDVLVKVLNDNPTIEIEMSSHTDSRAGDQYNLVLSDKRAKAAVNYLIQKGIASKRLTWKGYGESKLLNRCKNNVKCSEEEHQLNRRTEFKVTRIIK